MKAAGRKRRQAVTRDVGRGRIGLGSQRDPVQLVIVGVAAEQ